MRCSMLLAMANKMMYIRKGDETFWERGAQLAAEQGVSLSEFVGILLRKAVTEDQISKAGGGRPPHTSLDEAIELIAEARRALSETAL
jgi:hypothetical protein